MSMHTNINTNSYAPITAKHNSAHSSYKVDLARHEKVIYF